MNSLNLNQLLKSFEGKEILLIGDIGLDIYTMGEVTRISPEAPVPILCAKKKKYKLGLAANVADNIKALGAQPWMMGVIGADETGSQLKSILRQESIGDQFLLVETGRPTISKERITTHQQQLLRIDYEEVKGLESATLNKLLNTLDQIKIN